MENYKTISIKKVIQLTRNKKFIFRIKEFQGKKYKIIIL